MDLQPQTTKPISDDQELAKVLAGISKDTNTNLSFDDSKPADENNGDSQASMPGAPQMPPTPPPAPPVPPMPFSMPPVPPTTPKAPEPTMPEPKPEIGPKPEFDKPKEPDFNFDSMMAKMPPMPGSKPNNDLDSIRKDALNELRPLVDKLDLAPDEKFDIYLLLLRSTDDTTLIAPAHEAAKNIADEAKRAEALLDIIKEIDFLSAPIEPVQ